MLVRTFTLRMGLLGPVVVGVAHDAGRPPALRAARSMASGQVRARARVRGAQVAKTESRANTCTTSSPRVQLVALTQLRFSDIVRTRHGCRYIAE